MGSASIAHAFATIRYRREWFSGAYSNWGQLAGSGTAGLALRVRQRTTSPPIPPFALAECQPQVYGWIGYLLTDPKVVEALAPGERVLVGVPAGGRPLHRLAGLGPRREASPFKRGGA